MIVYEDDGMEEFLDGEDKGRPEMREFEGPMPGGTVAGLFEPVLKFAGIRLSDLGPDSAAVAFDREGGAYGLASGEYVDGRFVYTLADAPMPVPCPLGWLLKNTLDDLKAAKVEQFSPTPVAFTDGGRALKIARLRCADIPPDDEFKNGTKLLVATMAEDESAEAPKGVGDVSTGRIETARDFVSRIEDAASRSGRKLLEQPAICRDGDGELYTIRPRNDGGRQMLFYLQKVFDGMTYDDPEVMKVGELLDWAKKQNRPGARVFLTAGPGKTFGIDDVSYPAGGRLTVEVRPWGDLFEAAGLRKALKEESERARTEAWARCCGEDLLEWEEPDEADGVVRALAEELARAGRD